jgi:environmental stress-induced protein Ves
MQILRAASYRRMPWKNGGGETIEMMVSPPEASLDTFDWRISMARVAVDGPFSMFPGIDRTLGVIDGAGLVLIRTGQAEVRIGRETPPFSFAGDADVECRLLDGPIEDLNVMTRRGRWQNRVTRHRLGSSIPITWTGDLGIAVCVNEPVTLRLRDQTVTLQRRDAAVLNGMESAFTATAEGNGTELFMIELSQV